MKAIRDGSVDVSVLIVNYNSTGLALDLMRSLLAQDPRAPDGSRLRVECVFVDNASPMVDDEKLSEIRNLIGSELPGHVVLNTQNAGYAGGMNLAYRHARGEYVFVLNPDVMFFPDCTGRLYRYLVTHPDAGAAGPQAWWEHDKRVRLPPNILPTMWDLFFCTLAHIVPSVNRRYMDARVRATLRTWNTTRPVPMEMLSGACFMLPRSIIEQMGAFFDEGFPLYYEDTDLFRRIRLLGKKLVFVPEAEIVHFYNRSGTTNQEEAWRRYWKARSYYYRKWYGPAGSLLEAVSRRFLNTRVASHSRSDMERRVIDLGDVWEPPRLEFGRFLESCLIEICQDAAFLLAAGMLWSGSHWDPGSLFWRAFGESEYFLRIVDLSAGHPIEVKVYRFRRVPAPGAAPISTDETAPPDGEDREFGRVPLQA